MALAGRLDVGDGTQVDLIVREGELVMRPKQTQSLSLDELLILRNWKSLNEITNTKLSVSFVFWKGRIRTEWMCLSSFQKRTISS